MDKPIVTVSVCTYNSSKYVLETLESIKAQTYPNLILQIGDDCSTDNTIEICRRWIEQNKDRFVKTKIIVPKHNTGVAGNMNRSWDACETEWFKGVAGDDLLMPNCIEEYMQYVSEHPEIVFVFSRVYCFGTLQEQVDKVSSVFDYSFFELSSEAKMDRLFIRGNCIPAATYFCNIYKIRKKGIRHDERIPFLEDLPLWINVIKAGVNMNFVDKTLVKYRVGSGLSTKSPSLNFQKSVRLVFIYYKLPYLMEKCPEQAQTELAEYELELLSSYYSIQNSKPMRLRNAIVDFYYKIFKS